MKVNNRVGEGSQELLNPVFSKLKKIVSNKFNCDLNFGFLNDLMDEERELIVRSTENEPLQMFSKVLFPIYLNGTVLGAAKIQHPGHFSEEDLEHLHDLISLVLVPLFKSADQNQHLQMLEDQLRPSNDGTIVKISEFKRQSDPHVYKCTKKFNGQTEFNQPCLIEGTNRLDILKMAMEIHEKSHRYAFVHFDQVDSLVRQSASELEKIGNITLFIADIVTLKDSEIFALTELLKKKSSNEFPQFIVGSTKSIHSIVEAQIVPQELIQLLQVGYIRMASKVNQPIEKDMKNFFFDSCNKLDPLELT